jgi:glycosyltransferase involved in cell wall biosynthesis
MSKKEKPINIVFINPKKNIRRPISNISNLLKTRGFRVRVFTPRSRKNINREKTRHYDEYINVNIITYPIWTPTKGFTWPIPVNLEFLRKGVEILKKNEIIHVWVPFYLNTFILCLLKLLFFKKKKLILTMDTFPSYSFKASPILDILFKIFFKTLCKIAFLAADCCTIYGKSFLKYAEKAGVPKKKIIILPTGVSKNKIPKSKDIKTELNITKNDYIVLFVGLLNKRKGIDLIIKTAIKFKSSPIKFLIIGDGPYREKAEKLIMKYQLNEKVLLLGRKLDIQNYYHIADVFFLPSKGEGFAGVLLEAMLYEVPIITSDIPGTIDLITHMKNGLLCKKDDYICYAASIKKLLNENTLRDFLINNASKTVQNKFIWDKIIKRYIKLYNWILRLNK